MNEVYLLWLKYPCDFKYSTMFQFGPINHQSSPPIFDDGYCYVRSSSSDGLVYVKCHEKKKSNCRARGSTNGGPVTLTKGHNHVRNYDTQFIYNFMFELYRTVSTSLRNLRLIYDDVSVRHARASILVPFVVIVKTMRSWRKNNCPPSPKSLEEYVLLLNSARWKNFFIPNGSNITVTHVHGTDGSQAVVFVDSNLLLNFQTVDLYVDATYKVCPREPSKKIYQFFTIMASLNDTVLPVAWSFMSNKSKPCYAAVINHFVQLTPHLRVLSITSDFEIGLLKVFRDFYPNAISHGCYFHYVQALMKKAKKIGLLEKLREWEDGKEYFRKLIGLAFLPANQIQQAFDYLNDLYAVFLPHFQTFLTYYKSYWINNIKPENFTIYNILNRTNNFVESYNRRLKDKFGIHPRIWQFTELLINHYTITKNEVESLKISQLVRRSQRPHTLFKNDIILKAWELYNCNALDVEHFLQCISHIVPVLENGNLINSAAEVNNYINIPLKKFSNCSEWRIIYCNKRRSA
ncbi:uncharacterized protein LOC130671115 isoform X2 [Microplitis mediator]|uniref:uncharacterized protein LOC130670083 isoform X2 n=1 Tax=Microplitis mediator TaxID=375433 RepID=UPI00255453C0|nr:uncharacterized protein LOC130670083 isoform X2 [Microplitis mediator]XP_057330785.1 uncharacterized protein LOC130671101 isoform X2 [Microplitis mediator]XP_057330807.1 uncharacterized protein LOC130671115 isoform X2 [Microplitis mediator]